MSLYQHEINSAYRNPKNRNYFYSTLSEQKQTQTNSKQNLCSLISHDGSRHHRWIPVIAYNNDHVDGFTKKRFKNKKDREEKINDLKYRFATECKDAVSAGKCDTLILTSEHCHARLREEEEIERLYNFFKDIFDFD